MLHELRVKPGTEARIADRDPDDKLGVDKEEGEKRLEHLVERIDALQYRLYAEDRHSVLLVLQGLDASGKDGVVRRVFDGVNPTGVSVTSFKAPVGAELQHDYLWRIHAAASTARDDRHLQPLPLRGRRRGADVRDRAAEGVAPPLRAHPRLRADARGRGDDRVEGIPQRLPRGTARRGSSSGSTTPTKRWKFQRDDLKVRERFDDWIAAWDDALTETSTDWAPWYVVPADRNWLKALAVAELVVNALERLDPKLPAPEVGLEGLVV